MRIRQLIGLGVLLCGLGCWRLTANPGGVGVPLLIGAAAAFWLASICRSDRRRLLVRLVAQGDAFSLDEVRSLGDRLLSTRERLRLASALRAAVESILPGARSSLMVNPARVDLVAERLLQLSDAIADRGIVISAQAVALCRQLLHEPMRSPLYNPSVSELELPRLLDLVERGLLT
ncbi:MAG TPA: hypothetical protein VFP55_05710 [Solirubrobacteraceae bacterium]|nr:hypothetical protein [Solirubrobacteraceae bacterium]